MPLRLALSVADGAASARARPASADRAEPAVASRLGRDRGAIGASDHSVAALPRLTSLLGHREDADRPFEREAKRLRRDLSVDDDRRLRPSVDHVHRLETPSDEIHRWANDVHRPQPLSLETQGRWTPLVHRHRPRPHLEEEKDVPHRRLEGADHELRRGVSQEFRRAELQERRDPRTEQDPRELVATTSHEYGYRAKREEHEMSRTAGRDEHAHKYREAQPRHQPSHRERFPLGPPPAVGQFPSDVTVFKAQSARRQPEQRRFLRSEDSGSPRFHPSSALRRHATEDKSHLFGARQSGYWNEPPVPRWPHDTPQLERPVVRVHPSQHVDSDRPGSGKRRWANRSEDDGWAEATHVRGTSSLHSHHHHQHQQHLQQQHCEPLRDRQYQQRPALSEARDVQLWFGSNSPPSGVHAVGNNIYRAPITTVTSSTDRREDPPLAKVMLQSRELVRATQFVRNARDEIDWVATFLQVGFARHSIYALMCPRRKGRWKAEEERYALELLALLADGTLRLRTGESVRAFLSKKLHSDDMRVLKKLSNCKRFHFARTITPTLRPAEDPEDSADDDERETETSRSPALGRLAVLKREFLRAVQLEALVAVRRYLSDSTLRELLA